MAEELARKRRYADAAADISSLPKGKQRAQSPAIGPSKQTHTKDQITNLAQEFGLDEEEGVGVERLWAYPPIGLMQTPHSTAYTLMRALYP